MKHNISKREMQVLYLTAHEHTSKEIASKLYISDYTARDHRKSLLRKLKVKNVAGLIRRGFELGYLNNTQKENYAKLLQIKPAVSNALSISLGAKYKVSACSS